MHIRSLSNTETDDVVVMRLLSRGPYKGIAPPKMRKEILVFFFKECFFLVSKIIFVVSSVNLFI